MTFIRLLIHKGGMMAPKTIFMTGFPGFIGRALLETLLTKGRIKTAYLLVQEKFKEQAVSQADSLIAVHPGADLRIVTGDITVPGLGLSDEIAKTAKAEVETVYHLAALYDLAAPYDICHKINVQGTRNVLDFCHSLSSLDRLVYFSTFYVAGKRIGRIYEDDLIDKGFKNHYEATKFEAEGEVRKAMKTMPVVIIRPAIVVGDSRTGLTEKFDGPYFLLRFLLWMSSDDFPLKGMRMPSPYSGRGELNLVPIDYVAEATVELAEIQESLGTTFQLCDPNPWTAREILEEACRVYGLRPPLGYIPTPVTRTLFYSRKVREYFKIPQELIDYTSWRATCDDTNSRRILGKRGIIAPPIKTFFPAMLAFVRANPDTPSSAKF